MTDAQIVEIFVKALSTVGFFKVFVRAAISQMKGMQLQFFIISLNVFN